MLALTIGAGRRNPRGQRVDLPKANALPSVLGSLPARQEQWWSTHVWEEGHRSQDRWLGSAGVMVDIDYHDAEGHHVAPPPEAARALEQAARAGRIPGSAFHLTPRGARVIFLFGDMNTDRELQHQASLGAGVLIEQAIQQHPGYQVDRKVLVDLARLLFAPAAVVDGVRREAEVIQLQPSPFTPQQLALLAAPQPPKPAPKATPITEAIVSWNRAHAQDWGTHQPCPACDGKDSFGAFPGEPGRWRCFHASHEGPGVRGDGCYHGDALDLEAHRRGCTAVEVLRADGYLGPKPAPNPPQADVIPIRPETPQAITKTFASLCYILRHDKRIIPEPLEWNEMLHGPTIGGEPVDDATAAGIREKIELTIQDSKGKGLRFSAADIDQALPYVAQERPYNPVREYLQSLEWDGVERLDSVAEDILGAERTPIHQTMVRKWFISAAARALDPGCKVDTVLILYGPQGAGKSTFFAEIAGEAWFTDSPIDIESRDAMMILRRVWVLEWSELEAMQRARDVGTVKAFLSSRSDTFRPPYGKHLVTAQRHCVIVGTTNDEGFLADPTGNRRYWVLPVGPSVDIELLRQQRTQLLAEAVHRFRSKEAWWLTREEEAELTKAQKRFERRDPWDELVEGFVDRRLTPFSIAEVLEKAIEKPAGQWTRADENRVGSVLKRLGYETKRSWVDGKRVRLWEKGSE